MDKQFLIIDDDIPLNDMLEDIFAQAVPGIPRLFRPEALLGLSGEEV